PDEDTARAPELGPRGEMTAALIEQLYALVVPVGDEDASLRVEGDGVRHEELVRIGARAAPLREIAAFTRKFHDPVIRVLIVAVGHEHVTVRSDDHIGGAVEARRAVARYSSLAEPQQHLARGAELEDLMAAALASAPIR